VASPNPYAPLLDVIPVERREATVLGGTTAYWVYGPHDADTTVIAVHGFRGEHHGLEPVVAHLPDVRIISPDLPGFGDSEKPPPSKYPYTLAAFCEGLADLFGALSLPRAHLLGHGFGGTVALHFAAEHPELIDRLCLVAPMGDLAERPLRQALLLPMVGGLVFRQLAGRTLFRAVYRSWVNPKAPGPALDEYYESMTPPAARAALLATLRNGSGAQTLIADCRRVRAQSLFIWGANDRVFPITEGRAISREMPHAGFEVLPLGHAPHEEAPEQVAAIVERFFAGRRAGFA